MYEQLRVIKYPDPRLRQRSKPVEKFDDALAALAQRMLELMREHRGVGLAAPQVGVNKRLFVMNHTGNPEDDRIYVNPELHDIDGAEEDEEGCLSLPEVNALINRGTRVRMVAKNLVGDSIEQTESDYIARIWQHEFDHLEGILITDRMGDVSRMMHRKTLKELERKFEDAKSARKK